MFFGSSSSPRERGWDSQTWSLILGRVWGIRVRVHLLFIAFALYCVFRYLDEAKQGASAAFSFALFTGLFVSVLLHEFGHCFGCRAVGGHADDVLLWPLGGLAFCLPPHRPYEHLVTTLAGPFVHVAICILLLPVLILTGGMSWALWNPFSLGMQWDPYSAVCYLILLWKINYWLFLFNMCLPVLPFDLGRVIQELMWFRMGYYQATVIATSIGLIGGVLLAGLGLYLAGSISSSFLALTFLGIFGCVQSFQTRKQLELAGDMPENEFGYDFSQGYTSLERSMKGIQHKENSLSLRSRFRDWQTKRRNREEARLEAELDRILAKIHSEGINSLSRTERRLLHQASKKRRR